jgi:hypothetical protein
LKEEFRLNSVWEWGAEKDVLAKGGEGIRLEKIA